MNMMDPHYRTDKTTIAQRPPVPTGITRIFLLVFITAAITACATPAQRMDDTAAHLGYTRTTVTGPAFPEVIYEYNFSVPGRVLHVYLGGDGSPWLYRYWVSRDPTPRNPVMLNLMALDHAPSIYLSRPCYDGYASQAPCTPLLWTQARYSERVVANMTAVLQKILDADRFDGVVLFGYSGGGALALLLAERVPETRAIITIAGNLDTDAWTGYHGYSPLTDSLNPARSPPLAPSIVQLHIAGNKDTNIPPELTRRALEHQDHAHMVVLSGYDHHCCWQRIWPDVLKGVNEGKPWAYLGAAAMLQESGD